MDRKVKYVCVRSPKDVAARVSILSRRLERERIGTRGAGGPACRAGRDEEPAIYVTNHLRRADHVGNGLLRSEGIYRVADSAAGAHREWLALGERVGATCTKSADNPGKRAVRCELPAFAKG